MKKKQIMTRIEVIVVIFVLLFIVLVFLPSQGKVKTIAQRVVCGTNLKGLGTASTVYANDYDGEYVRLGKGTWSKELGYSYEDTDFDAYNFEGASTITSSLYLLVREADVTPKSFICPSSNQFEFDGQNTKNLDIIELWDFGPVPHNHVSYVYHHPYGQFPANGSRSSSFAIMADMSPWFFEGNIVKAGENPQIWEDELPKETNLRPPQIINIDNTSVWKSGNTPDHFKNDRSLYALFSKRYRFGQNVLYADGHSEFVNYSNVGVDNDNIYTYWSTDENPTEQDTQGGTAPTGRSPENDAKSKEDSFLVL